MSTSIALLDLRLATGHHEWSCETKVWDPAIKALIYLWGLRFLLYEVVVLVIDPAPDEVVQRAGSALVQELCVLLHLTQFTALDNSAL